MTLARDIKTPEQLEREIAYYRAQLERRTSPVLLARARRAIVLREQKLAIAQRVKRVQ